MADPTTHDDTVATRGQETASAGGAASEEDFFGYYGAPPARTQTATAQARSPRRQAQPAPAGFAPAAWLQAHGGRIVRFLARDDASRPEVEIETLRQSEGRMTFRFRVEGRDAVVKAFDKADPAAQAAARREIACARILHGTALVPRGLGHSEADAFLISEYLGGRVLTPMLTGNTLSDIASAMGDWYATLDAITPDTPHETTWLDYLGHYAELKPALQDPQARRILADLPISRLSLCRNDAHTSNFIVTGDGRLMGVDFESAAMKPQGWDILLSARDLSRRFPRRIEATTAALVDGWGGGIGEVGTRRFLWLARFFVQATLSSRRQDAQP